MDEAALEAESLLDGCYVLETGVDAEHADAQTVHDRYKDLALVEDAFRVSKNVIFAKARTGHLELRPIYVRSERSTRGHVFKENPPDFPSHFVVMLAYLIRRELQRAGAHLDVTVEEGLDSLKTLCLMRVRLPGSRELPQVPTPREQSKALLDALGLEPPPCLPKRDVRVATKRKLPSRRVTLWKTRGYVATTPRSSGGTSVPGSPAWIVVRSTGQVGQRSLLDLGFGQSTLPAC